MSATIRGQGGPPAVILAASALRLSPIPSTPVSPQATPVRTSLPLPLKPRVSGWEQNSSAQALETNVFVSGRLKFPLADRSPTARCCVGSCSRLWLCGLGSPAWSPGLSPLRGNPCRDISIPTLLTLPCCTWNLGQPLSRPTLPTGFKVVSARPSLKVSSSANLLLIIQGEYSPILI